jgi:hypothetical protein
MLRQPNLSCRNTSTTGVNLASVEENNYYPRGFEHREYNNVVNSVESKFQTFQGQQIEKELGKNM